MAEHTRPLRPSAPPIVMTAAGHRLLVVLSGWSLLSCLSLLAAGNEAGVIGEPVWALIYGAAALVAALYAIQATNVTLYALTAVLLPLAPLGRAISLVAGALFTEDAGPLGLTVFRVLGWLILGWLIRMAVRRMVPDCPPGAADAPRR